MKIHTNRYHDFTPSQGIPARITYGSPRWRLPYTIAASAKTVTPGRWFMEGPDEEFTERYRAMPDPHGVARLTLPWLKPRDSCELGLLALGR